MPWESTISTYELSKILQVSCHVATNKKLLSKYVWLISAEKISFVRTCCGSNKSNGLHNKGFYHKGQYNVTLFCIKEFVIQTKGAWQPLLPSAKGLSFTLCFYFMLESRWSSPFLFSFYPLASSLFLKDHDIYIQLDVRHHELLLLTLPLR